MARRKDENALTDYRIFDIRSGRRETMPPPIEHRPASQREWTPRPAPGRILPISIPLPRERCFLRLANLPNFALDRLSRYEAILWRQANQILFALDALDRRELQDRGRRLRIGSQHVLPVDARDDY